MNHNEMPKSLVTQDRPGCAHNPMPGPWPVVKMGPPAPWSWPHGAKLRHRLSGTTSAALPQYTRKLSTTCSNSARLASSNWSLRAEQPST